MMMLMVSYPLWLLLFQWVGLGVAFGMLSYAGSTGEPMPKFAWVSFGIGAIGCVVNAAYIMKLMLTH